MKKYILLFLLITIFSETDAQFIRRWEKSSALGNLPSWFSSSGNTERGIAYLTQNNNPRLYVISNKVNPTVIILNALTGDSIGTLNTTGVTGGTIPLNDISSDGIYSWSEKMYACNYTLNPAVSPFKIYMWENESSAPVVIVIDSISNYPLGDRLDVSIMEWGNGRRLLTAVSNTNRIVQYLSGSGTPPFVRQELILNDGNLGNNASVSYNFFVPYPGGGFFINSDSMRPKVYDSSGIFLAQSWDTTVSASTNAIKYHSNGTLCCDIPYFVTYNYQSNKADLVMSWGVPNYEYRWGSTPSLGNNVNPQNFGDVEFIWRAIDTLLIFVLAGNNGLGAYHAYGLILPVELISFTAVVKDKHVLLSWSTATEINNKGFEVERLLPGSDWETIAFVPGSGTTTERKDYFYKDLEIIYGNISYRLKQIDFDGSFEYSDVITADNSIPSDYILYQNYPNPFNPNTRIKYSVPINGYVSLKMYDMLGKEVKTLISQDHEAGTYEIILNAEEFSSGIYFYRLTAGSFTTVKKLELLK